MVGVPRSKGCRNCVQSRVKCDQTRPSCSRCQRRAVPCPGYGPKLKFQDEGPRLEERYKKKADRPSAYLHSTSTPERTPTPEECEQPLIQLGNGLDGLDRFLASMADIQLQVGVTDPFSTPADEAILYDMTSPNTEATTLYRTLGPKASHLPPRLSPTPILNIVNSPQGMQRQLLSWYIHSTTYINVDIPGPKYQLNWLKRVYDYQQSSLLLDHAVRACTLSHLGRSYDSEPFVRASNSFYQSALQRLAQTLSDDRDNNREGKSSTTLAATLFLSIYEMYTCTTKHSWVKHAGGAGALMRIRGANAHRTGFDRSMYLAFRNILIVEAFESNTPCFLSEPEWQQLDEEISAEFSTSKNPLHRRMDRFYADIVKVPGLCSDTQAAITNHHKRNPTNSIDPDTYATTLRNLLSRTLSHRSHLLLMLSRFQSALPSTSNPQQYFRTIPNPDSSPSSSSSSPSPFPHIYTFSDVFVATVLGTTYIILTALDMNVLGICSEYSSTFPSPSSSIPTLIPQPPLLLSSTLGDCVGFPVAPLTSPHQILQSGQSHARHACMCVPWMTESNFVGPFYATFALRIALRALGGGGGGEEEGRRRREGEREWIRGWMRRVGRKMGIAGVGAEGDGVGRVKEQGEEGEEDEEDEGYGRGRRRWLV
ncbi:MAG: hypothetical protein Q9160_001524 [Pyrenula sp. 1 TL-2023]